MSETYPPIDTPVEPAIEPVRIIKPGYQTTEFWITIAVQVIAAIAMFLPPDSAWQKIIAMVVSILTGVSYNAQRGTLKQRALDTVDLITRATRPRVNILAMLLIPLCMLGCQNITPVSVQADQARKNAVEPVILEHVQRHPEQAQTWEDFLWAWQRSIDSRQSAVGGGQQAKPLVPNP